MESPEVVLIAISGPSSSGKTTVSKSLFPLFTNCRVVHQDDFYLPDDEIPVDPKTGEQNWDEPGAVDFGKFKKYLRTIKSGKQTETMKTYELDSDLKLSDSEISSLQSKYGQIFNSSKLIVLVDGFMLYYDKELIDLFDIKLFYHASHDTLKTRRESRVGYTTVAGFWVDPPNYFDDYVWPAYEKYHRTFFNNNNVDDELSENAKNLKILGYRNETDSKLIDLVTWALTTIDHHNVL